LTPRGAVATFANRVTWIFAYGSLMWRPGFDFEERRVGFIQGYRRRFWQGSTDHRGVPGAPGRVVTLLDAPAERCGGIAYRLAPADVGRVLGELDHREKGGYERRIEAVLDAAGAPFAEALVYIATRDNDDYLGCAPLPAIAAQIRASSGPSGHNVEYVLRLAEALREIGVVDAHVTRVAELVAPSSHLMSPRDA
jgi:glutathione-specific gamma-glutamylcyclotransferase